MRIKNAILVWATLMFLSFLLPIHVAPYRTYYHETLAALSVLFAFGCFAAQSSSRIYIPHIILIPIVILAEMGIQASDGMFIFLSDLTFPALTLLVWIIAMCLGATLAAQEKGLEKLSAALAIALLAAGLVSVLIQHIQLVNWPMKMLVFPMVEYDHPRPYSNLAQPNLTALLMCFSIASVWYLNLIKRVNSGFAILMVIVLLWGIALTQSRIAWMILPLFALLSSFQIQEKPWRKRFVIIFLLALFAGFVIILPHFFTLFGYAIDSVSQRAGQTSVRLILWQQAWHMSLMRPWLGVGWGQFGPNQLALCELFAPTEYADNAHNIVLNFAAEMGWPVTVLLVLGVCYWFYVCCIARSKTPEVKFLCLVLLAIGVHSMVEFPVWYGFFLMPLGVILGALHVGRMKSDQVVFKRAWFVIMTSVSLVATAAITYDYQRVIDGFTALHYVQNGKKPPVGSIEMPDFTLFPEFYDFFRLIKLNSAPNASADDILRMQKISMRFGHTAVLARAALMFANNGMPDESRHALLTVNRLFNGKYREIYEEWAKMANESPARYAGIFKQLPAPTPVETDDESD